MRARGLNDRWKSVAFQAAATINADNIDFIAA